MIWLILLLIPVGFAWLHKRTHRYPFSPAVTLSCGGISLLCGCPVLALGLCVSALGDWFLNHERGRIGYFLGGVGGFFLGHLCFLTHSLIRGGVSWICAGISLLIFALISLFLLRRLRIRERGIRYAVVLYALISCFSFGCSLRGGFDVLPGILFTAGIFMILFSDCIIALSRFGGVKGIGKWIMPTYFACHILIAVASVMQCIIRNAAAAS
ncbi:MAG: hypothetical protein J6N32_05325 [Clostridia bacterium]|nr:hypothetical protein [Clostridia bacterium]